MELTSNNLIEKLKDLKDESEKAYIKNNWFDFEELKNLFDGKEQNGLSIVDCINQCTSPDAGNIDEKLKLIFKAFSLFKPEDTRVLILGQDPYPSENKACGLAFLHNTECKIDKSLNNILSAIKSVFQNSNETNNNSSNEDWVNNNKVLLLNTSLTYEKHEDYGKPYNNNKSEKNIRKKETEKIKIKHQKAWKPFIQQIICKLLTSKGNLSIFLWGKDAQLSFIEYINNVEIKKNIRIFSCYHPTPKNENNKENLDENLLFSKAAPEQFKFCNKFLKENNEKEIDWAGLLKIYNYK